MPKHIVRLLLLIAAFATVAYTAMRLFTADSFFRYGHYRGDAVAEIASDKPKYEPQESCRPCHTKQYAEWQASVHNKADVGKGVKCEVCHGPGGGRDDKGLFEHASTGPEHPKNLKLFVAKDTAAQCTWCHVKMPGRPLEQRQVDVATHAGSEQCNTCHNPHSPRTFVVANAAVQIAGDASAGRAKATACFACHGEKGISRNLPGPSLAGQRAPYIVAALREYQSGSRDNPLMAPMAQGLSAADIGDLAVYFSSQRCKSSPHAGKDAAVGHTLVVKCANCHGEKGISTQSAWPNLAGQSSEYLAAALTAYKSGGRKNLTMAGMSNGLSDAEATELSAYFAASACN
jgi:cytochrome c553